MYIQYMHTKRNVSLEVTDSKLSPKSRKISFALENERLADDVTPRDDVTRGQGSMGYIRRHVTDWTYGCQQFVYCLLISARVQCG